MHGWPGDLNAIAKAVHGTALTSHTAEGVEDAEDRTRFQKNEASPDSGNSVILYNIRDIRAIRGPSRDSCSFVSIRG